MSSSSRIVLFATLAFGAACVDPITPIALDLALEPSYVPNGDGTCTARITTIASGIGTATWERVTIARGGVAQTEYTGAQVADFWGATSISAGQIQESTPIDLPATASDYDLVLRYGIGGSVRDMTLRMDCAIGA